MAIRKSRRGQRCPREIVEILRCGFDLARELPEDPRDNPEPLRVFWEDPVIREKVKLASLEHHGEVVPTWAEKTFGE